MRRVRSLMTAIDRDAAVQNVLQQVEALSADGLRRPKGENKRTFWCAGERTDNPYLAKPAKRLLRPRPRSKKKAKRK